MLDLAAAATRTSRLACQIVLDDARESLTVRVPGLVYNMQGM
jgi:ferredoxin